MEIYVDDEAKLTLHGLTQKYVKLEEDQKNRKLFDLLDEIEFNQVCDDCVCVCVCVCVFCFFGYCMWHSFLSIDSECTPLMFLRPGRDLCQVSEPMQGTS